MNTCILPKSKFVQLDNDNTVVRLKIMSSPWFSNLTVLSIRNKDKEPLDFYRHLSKVQNTNPYFVLAFAAEWLRTVDSIELLFE